MGGLDINCDEFGHGTAEAANLLAVAPGITFSFVKYSDGWSNSFPVTGFQRAVQNQNPDIITCSWGTLDAAIYAEIANAVAYLASDKAKYMSGATMNMMGGLDLFVV